MTASGACEASGLATLARRGRAYEKVDAPSATGVTDLGLDVDADRLLLLHRGDHLPAHTQSPPSTATAAAVANKKLMMMKEKNNNRNTAINPLIKPAINPEHRN